MGGRGERGGGGGVGGSRWKEGGGVISVAIAMYSRARKQWLKVPGVHCTCFSPYTCTSY